MVSVKIFLAVLVSLTSLLLAFLFLIAWLLDTQAKERENLYNRLQAGNLNEFRAITDNKPPPKGGNMVTAGLKRAAEKEGFHEVGDT